MARWTSPAAVGRRRGFGVLVAVLAIGVGAQARHRVGHRHLALVHRALPRLPAGRAGCTPPGCWPWSSPGCCWATSRRCMQTASSRLSERINWSTIQFMLENAVFLHDRPADAPARRRRRGRPASAWAGSSARALAVLVAVMRAAAGLGVPVRAGCPAPGAGEAGADRRGRTARCISWAGMRGVVTLAAAFTLPEETPQRGALVLIAMVVTVGTLLLQGSTLPWLARRARRARPRPARGRPAGGDDPAGAVAGAGLQALEAAPRGRRRDRRDRSASAPRTAPTASGSGWAGARRTTDETPERDLPAGAAAHAAGPSAPSCCGIRDAGTASTSEVLGHVLGQLDIEESMLDRDRGREPPSCASDPLLPAGPTAGECEHLAAHRDRSWRRPARRAARSACARARPGSTCGCA